MEKKKMREALISRLYNHKFEQAKTYLKYENNETKVDVGIMADTFGNEGWNFGNIGRITQMAVWHLTDRINKSLKEEKNGKNNKNN